MKTAYKLREIAFYKKRAQTYDKPADSPSLRGMEHSQRIVAEFTSQLKDATILDLGCGTGGVAVAAQNCTRIIGIDLSTEMLHIAKGKIRNPKPDMDLVRADIFNLPLRNGAFDAVISMGVLGVHVPLTENLLSCLHSLLKSSGHLLFHTNTFRKHWRKIAMRKVFELLRRSPDSRLLLRWYFPIQPYAEALCILKEKLRGTGFVVEKAEKIRFAADGYVVTAHAK